MSELAQAALALATQASFKVDSLEKELDRTRDDVRGLEKTVNQMVGASLFDQFTAFRKVQEEDARRHAAELASLKVKIESLNHRDQKKSPGRA